MPWPQYGNKFLVWHKKFGPSQNILGPVKGQGMNGNHLLVWHKKFGPAPNVLVNETSSHSWTLFCKKICLFQPID
jgi:hypothetical protein